MLCCPGLANAVLPQLLGFQLSYPAPDGALAKFHITADLTNAQALNLDHLRYLKLEA